MIEKKWCAMHDVNFSSLEPILLKPADIPLFRILQARTLRRLSETDEQYFLKPKSVNDLKVHLAASMPIVGIKCGGWLVAQALLTFPKFGHAVKNLEGYPIEEQDIPTTAILQSLCVDPKMRGHKLPRIVLEQVFSIAAQTIHDETGQECNLLAKAAEKNVDSKKCLKAAGFQEIGEGLDPHGEYPVVYFKRVCSAASTPLALNT